MSGFPGSPRLVKGGIVLVDPDSSAIKKVIPLQYNPDTLTRTLQVQGSGGDAGAHSEVLRLKGPPVESIKLDAELDASDQLEHADDNPTTVQLGLHPQLAALETMIYPTVQSIQTNKSLAESGVLEIIPAVAPLTLFVWSRTRVVPVRITELSITEEAFDPALNPIRAKVSLGLRVLNVNDLGYYGKAASIYLVHHQQKEQLAARGLQGVLSQLGITGLP
ncbi:MAG TPA: hypothetical protein VHE35_28280 [Kofleriaceae bacterium]|nr:hypothetical protein [Kofleriaceae bacterium]